MALQKTFHNLSAHGLVINIFKVETNLLWDSSITFFEIFSCKCFAGTWLPKDRAFRDRCIKIPMVEGQPEKDEIKDEDIERFGRLRLKLLAWRMMTYFEPLPEIACMHTDVWRLGHGLIDVSKLRKILQETTGTYINVNKGYDIQKELITYLHEDHDKGLKQLKKRALRKVAEDASRDAD